MKADFQLSEPITFNLLKHHLGFIKEFIDYSTMHGGLLLQSLSHIGTTVMDIYTGELSADEICDEITEYLRLRNLLNLEKYSDWTGIDPDSFRIIVLSDDSKWTMKFNNDQTRYVHIFPARNSRYTFRVKGNTLKSALIYIIEIGKDMVTGEDLNKVRPLLGLSPVKNETEAAAIVEMIEILRR